MSFTRRSLNEFNDRRRFRRNRENENDGQRELRFSKRTRGQSCRTIIFILFDFNPTRLQLPTDNRHDVTHVLTRFPYARSRLDVFDYLFHAEPAHRLRCTGCPTKIYTRLQNIWYWKISPAVNESNIIL